MDYGTVLTDASLRIAGYIEFAITNIEFMKITMSFININNFSNKTAKTDVKSCLYIQT